MYSTYVMKGSYCLKEKIKPIIKFICFCLIFVLLFIGIGQFLTISERQTVASVEGLFKEPEDSIDVVFLGASEIYADYCPTAAWSDYGYTSYSLSVTGAPGSLYKSMLREVLELQSPKLVVVEMNGFLQSDKYYARSEKLHAWIDAIPGDENRQLAIREAVPEDQQDQFKRGALSTFVMNHNNWKLLGPCILASYSRIRMSFKDQGKMKGFATFATLCDPEESKHERKIHFTEKSQAYLDDFMKYCKENNIEVLFARFPHDTTIVNAELYDEVEAFVENHGYRFVNFEEIKQEIDIDDMENYYNPEHLNAAGALKFTNYLGQYLVDNYDIVGEHSKEIADNWNDCAKEVDTLLSHVMKETQSDTKRLYSNLNL